MENPLAAVAVLKAAGQDYLRSRATFVLFAVFFKMLEAWLLGAAVAFALAAALAGAGQVAVSNRDKLDFLLTVPGLLYAVVLATAAVAALLLEQAGVMAIAGIAAAGSKLSPGRMAAVAARSALGIAKLGALKALFFTLCLLPFVGLGLLVYLLLLTEQDIYYYINERPPTFWYAAAAGAVILLAAAAVSSWFFVRWSFALPILLFEAQSARSALAVSAERVRGIGWRVALFLIGWQACMLLASLGLLIAFRSLAAWLVDGVGLDSLPYLFLLLLGQGSLIAVLSFFRVVGQGLLTRQLYVRRCAQLGIQPAAAPQGDEAADPAASPWPRWMFYLWLLLMLVAPAALWAQLSRNLADRPPVGVTAHRGHARAAPENTLAALRKAIESGADWAEIDVQPTADGVVVLLHDRDLLRVAGDPRRLADVPLAEVKKLEAGRWFSPAFAGEPIPTLKEAIELARGKLKLHIELKNYGSDQRLAEEVARLVAEEKFEDECLVAGFSHDAVQAARRVNPKLKTGLIVAQGLGDVSRLDVDVLSVRADHLTDKLLREAHRRGREVHVWTVNDPVQMALLIKRGVDNILTSDPDLLLDVKRRMKREGKGERLQLAARVLLGLEPQEVPEKEKTPKPDSPQATPSPSEPRMK